MGTLILFLTALPAAIQHDGTAVAGIVMSMVLLALGSGGVRAAVTPFIGSQSSILHLV